MKKILGLAGVQLLMITGLVAQESKKVPPPPPPPPKVEKVTFPKPKNPSEANQAHKKTPPPPPPPKNPPKKKVKFDPPIIVKDSVK